MPDGHNQQPEQPVQKLRWEEPCIVLERSLESRAQETLPREPWSGPIVGPLGTSGGGGGCF